MPKFRKVPVTIEAFQLPTLNQEPSEELIDFICNSKDAIWSDYDGGVSIETTGGTMRGNPGDWIIKGVAGEYYPCKNDIFIMVYEPI